MRRPTARAFVAALAIALVAKAPPALALQEHQHEHTAPPQQQPPSAPQPQNPHAGHQMPAEPPDQTVETPEPSGPAVRLADLEQTALKNSPAVRQAEAAVRAAEGRARQAGLYPNPTAGYIGEEIKSGPETRGGEHGFFFDQTIVLGGKLGKRRDVFLQAVKQAEAELEVANYRVLNTVRLAYFEALAAQGRVAFLGRLVELVDEAVRTSYGLYNAGQADRPDVLEIEIENRQAQLELVRARLHFEQARQQLAIAVGDPGAAIGRFEGTLEDTLPRIDVAILNDILSRSPQLAAARAGVDRAEAALRAARAERIPDMFVRGGAQYNRELLASTNEPVGWQGLAEVGIGVPIFNRNQGGIAAAAAELVVAEAEVRRQELVVRSRFVTAFTAYQDALRTSEAYRTEIIPKADEAYRLYLAKYEMMNAAYPQVLIARRTWLHVNLDYIDALEQLYRAALPLQGFLLTDDMASPGSTLGPLALPGTGRDRAEDPR
jgi:cobalt-zinc-cadmium efflux system outer membrane protein